MGDFGRHRSSMDSKKVLSKAEGDILANVNLSPNRDFKEMMWDLFTRSYRSYNLKVQEACRNPPLDAWVVEITFLWREFSQMGSSVQIFPRRGCVDEAVSAGYPEAAKQLAASVPVDHVRVCLLFPAKGWFVVFDRHIEWAPDTDGDGKILLTNRPTIAMPSQSEVAKFGQSQSAPSGSPSASSLPMVQEEILIANETVVTQTKQPGEEATDPSIQTNLPPDQTEESPSGSQEPKGESPEAA